MSIKYATQKHTKTCRLCAVVLACNNTSGMCNLHRHCKQGRHCKSCDAFINDKNLSGSCRQCYRTDSEARSARNGMKGRSVLDVWTEKFGHEEATRRHDAICAKHVANSRALWQDQAYRETIKRTTTGLKRSEAFKQRQHDATVRQMEDPAQRALRSRAITQSYARGTHSADNVSSNRYGNRGYDEFGCFYASDVERKRMSFLRSMHVSWKRYEVSDFPFRFWYTWDGNEHVYLPDFVITRPNGTVVIEEMKSRIDRMTERERVKCAVGTTVCQAHGLEYRVIDDVKHPV